LVSGRTNSSGSVAGDCGFAGDSGGEEERIAVRVGSGVNGVENGRKGLGVYAERAEFAEDAETRRKRDLACGAVQHPQLLLARMQITSWNFHLGLLRSMPCRVNAEQFIRAVLSPRR
jgi:hypothetical protein